MKAPWNGKLQENYTVSKQFPCPGKQTRSPFVHFCWKPPRAFVSYSIVQHHTAFSLLVNPRPSLIACVCECIPTTAWEVHTAYYLVSHALTALPCPIYINLCNNSPEKEHGYSALLVIVTHTDNAKFLMTRWVGKSRYGPP